MTDGIVPGLDHLVWAAPSLVAGSDAFQAATGVQPQPGGKHEGLGTHNALVGLGGGAYFEIIAVDPEQPGGPLAEAVGHRDPPQLIAWAARVTDANATADRARRLGLLSRVVPMERATPAGDLKRWKVVVVGGHPFRGGVPFFIDWLDTPHPSEVLASRARLDAFELSAPASSELGDLLRSFDLDVAVHEGPVLRLCAAVTGRGGTLSAAGVPTGLMNGLL